jgi:hypothetical protein
MKPSELRMLNYATFFPVNRATGAAERNNKLLRWSSQQQISGGVFRADF